jgi:hypothetical protein
LPLEKPRFHEALEGYVAFVPAEREPHAASIICPRQPTKGRRAIGDRRAQRAGNLKLSLPAETLQIKSPGGDAIDPVLILMSLLIGYPDHLGELLLGQTQHNPAFADAPADMVIDGGG